MKKTTALALLFAVGLLSGCNSGKDEVTSDGTKWFGKRVLADGTTTAKRIEFPSGQKDFNETSHPDGTKQIALVERPDGTKYFDQTILQDGTRKVAHVEWPNGVKWFDVTLFPDGKSKKIARSELPNGEKNFEVTVDKGGRSEIKRIEYPDGRVQTDVTQLADGSIVENKRSSEVTNDADLTWESPLCTEYGDLKYAKLGRSGSDARKRVAEALTEVADNKFGPGVIFASAAGPDNGVLLLAATPENERSLRFFGTKNVQTIRDRAELCAEDGFRQVQLIVRQDDGVNQRVVRKVVLDHFEAERYMSQTHGAKPE